MFNAYNCTKRLQVTSQCYTNAVKLFSTVTFDSPPATKQNYVINKKINATVVNISFPQP